MKGVFALFRYNDTRFGHSNDWRRLAILGILLITFGVLSLADALTTKPAAGHFGGGSAIFSGAAIVILILRIARYRIYVDWMLNAIFCIGAGFALNADETVGRVVSLVLVCTFLSASGTTRIWIGMSSRAGASWMIPSGCIALLGGLWIVGALVLHMPKTPPEILNLDSLFHGLAIVGFGFSLKET